MIHACRIGPRGERPPARGLCVVICAGCGHTCDDHRHESCSWVGDWSTDPDCTCLAFVEPWGNA